MQSERELATMKKQNTLTNRQLSNQIICYLIQSRIIFELSVNDWLNQPSDQANLMLITSIGTIANYYLINF